MSSLGPAFRRCDAAAGAAAVNAGAGAVASVATATANCTVAILLVRLAKTHFVLLLLSLACEVNTDVLGVEKVRTAALVCRIGAAAGAAGGDGGVIAAAVFVEMIGIEIKRTALLRLQQQLLPPLLLLPLLRVPLQQGVVVGCHRWQEYPRHLSSRGKSRKALR